MKACHGRSQTGTGACSAARHRGAARDRQGHCPTGIGAIDQLLGGGWPRGALSELCGRRSSGRTSVLLASLAAALAAGHATALVDVDGTLDPRGAAAAGVPLAQLLWMRAGRRQALKAADLLIARGRLRAGGARSRRRGRAHPQRGLDAAEARGRAAADGGDRGGAAARRSARSRPARSICWRRAPLFDDDGPPLLAAMQTAVEVRRHRRSNDVAARRAPTSS